VLINLNSKGVPVKCVSSVDGGEPASDAQDSTELVAARGSGITSVKDLAGKNVAEVQLTSLNSLAVEVLAKRAGIDPLSIHQVAMPFPQMPAALAQGRVQAAVIVAPFVNTALAQGATVLAHPNVALFPNGTITCLDALGSYISGHQSVVTAFRAAMDSSIAYSKTQGSVRGTGTARARPRARVSLDPFIRFRSRAQYGLNYWGEFKHWGERGGL
jgi:NitT/TauT family transport system substrate-binding protein